jgi:hypothetical protein
MSRRVIHIFYPVAGNVEVRVVDCESDHASLDRLLRPILDGADFEHVLVSWNGTPSDMFVGEESSLRDLPMNHKATRIYRARQLERYPRLHPDCLPAIHGVAVLFEEIIWR